MSTWNVGTHPVFTPGLHVVTEGSVVVATCEREQDARQIAHEHNTHAALVEALELLKTTYETPWSVLTSYRMFTAWSACDAALAVAKGGPA